MNQTVDKRIIERIYELAKKNVTAIKEVKRCLEESWSKSYSLVFQRAVGLRRRIVGTIPVAGTYEITLHEQLRLKSIATMIKSLLFEK